MQRRLIPQGDHAKFVHESGAIAGSDGTGEVTGLAAHEHAHDVFGRVLAAVVAVVIDEHAIDAGRGAALGPVDIFHGTSGKRAIGIAVDIEDAAGGTELDAGIKAESVLTDVFGVPKEEDRPVSFECALRDR